MNEVFAPFSKTEHDRFIEALEQFGTAYELEVEVPCVSWHYFPKMNYFFKYQGCEWESIAAYVGGSRTVEHVKLHAFRYESHCTLSTCTLQEFFFSFIWTSKLELVDN